ncbi:hypothetical protein SDC9_205819 [bioreactor metagenome]|uniref:Uncharacterized protein n=1 Tax=bioreactor metagenome TaxID=1076179 RepID=A0A645J379_9ZZZZ
MRVFIQQRLCRENHARRAKAALDRAAIHKSLLEPGKLAVLRNALDGDDRMAFGLACQHKATRNGFPVQNHGAGAAFPFGAALFCSRKANHIPDEIQQAHGRVNFHSIVLPVYFECHLAYHLHSTSIRPGKRTP